MRTISSLIIFIALLYAQEGGRYLIITHDDFYDAIMPLADWKRQKGLKPEIIRLSTIGYTAEEIKNFITEAYIVWQIKPEYLLLVGSDQHIPFPQYFIQGHLVKSDNYYTDIFGDFHNEIIPGRIWVHDTLEAKTVVAKVLGYEMTPFLDDQLWFRKGVTIVNEYEQGLPPSDSVYWADAHYAHELMNNAGFVHIDSFAYSFGDSSLDVINAINDGRSYILYRGIAGQNWVWPFGEIYPELMHNGFKLPIVISATCGTIDGIGHWWLDAGTPEEPKGVVGFFGTTTALFEAAEQRSALARGTLESIFCDSLTTLGKAAESGRLNYYSTFNDTLDYDGWNCLGDPEMTLWTSTPKQIQVMHFPETWLGATLSVNVTYNSMPVESALVCVMAKYDSSVYHYARTNANGTVIFLDSLSYPDTALITVTGRNLLPSVDTLVGGHSGGPLLAYRRHLVLDTLSGNANYQANNGEDFDLAVWIVNFGDSTAYNVLGLLQKAEPDDYYQLSDTIKYFGNVPSLDSAFTSDNGFDVFIDPDCPDSHEVYLKLTLRDALDSTWISYFHFRVYSPRPYLIYKSHLILDTISGNGNYQVNPGEDIELPVWLQNIGDSLAENVYGMLQQEEPDSYYTLNDTIKYFGTILPGDSAWTFENGYNVLVDSSCPDLHEIKLQLQITDSLDSVWVYAFSLINYAPILLFHNYYIDDSLKYIVHGDTAHLVVHIQNDGSFIAENVIGTLLSNDTLLTVIQANASFGSVLPDSIASNQSNPFIIAASPLAPHGCSSNLRLAVDAGSYRDTIDITIYIGKQDYLVWDPDINHTSGFIIHTKLVQGGFIGEYRREFPHGYLNVYNVLLTMLGMAGANYVISDTSIVIPEIIHFLNTNGKMYLEGGDVWYYDVSHGGYNFCPHFCILAISNNIGYFSGASGVDSTFTQGMNFDYTGENPLIDRINPIGNGVLVLSNTFNGFGCGVAANHRTVGFSIELAGLVDAAPPSTKSILIDSIMHYFGIFPTGIQETQQSQNLDTPYLTVYPNPTRKMTNISFGTGHSAKGIELKIYDCTGRFVKQFLLPTDYSLLSTVLVWDGTDNAGRRVPEGIYFVRLETEDYKETLKIIFLK